MLGIMMKDLYENFRIKKNLLGWIFGAICITFCMVALKNPYSYMLLVLICLPMISTSLLQYAVEQDEISQFDQILLTYPLTKKEIMLAKYLLGCLSLVVTALISFGITLIYVYGYQTIDFKTGLQIWAVGVVASILFLAICYFGFVWLGNKKGTVMFIIMISALAIGYVFTSIHIGIDELLLLDKTLLIGSGLVVSLVMLVLSFYGSLKIYTKRYS